MDHIELHSFSLVLALSLLELFLFLKHLDLLLTSYFHLNGVNIFVGSVFELVAFS